ncbi:beta-N-acetylhexosaminidase [Paenibacillus pinistramenti]|uniref:beta-N-acetylhexosaminidase n=1 Tax=Paenibacillus pinistramenti TaxID=1768003 RepID=UPI0011084F05|nr:beta-N-acetylhexosaminidase [Paenibacillus pinistramenti]
MYSIKTMTLEQKIGQLFICGFHSLTPDAHITALIEEYHIGGVVYFRRNVESAAQLAKLSKDLQQMAGRAGAPPLLIAIDQEGGMVSRLDHEGISRIPGNMSLGAADDPALTEAVAELSACELKLLGMNMNFAPCVDVNNNPLNPVIGVRSYSEDPVKVAEHGEAAVRGFRRHGIIATAKHFPGHGDTSVDSHLGLASVPHGSDRLHKVELLPFKRLIEAGAEAIMTAHVVFPAFEPNGNPATLSRKVLKELLRDELKFEGIIVTDCLEMKAISEQFGVAEGAVMALEAGADLVLVSHTLSEQEAAVRAAIEAVRSGRLPEADIDRSLERILAIKSGFGQMSAGNPAEEELTEPGRPLLPPERTVSLLEQAARKSITLVKNEGAQPPLPLDPSEPVLVVWPELRHRTEVDEAAEYRYTLGDALKPYYSNISQMKVGTHPAGTEVQEVLEQASGYKQAVAVTYTSEGKVPEGQVELVKGLMQLMRQGQLSLTVVSSRNPYDLLAFPEVDAYLCAYENRPYTLDALAKVLAGKEQPGGKLPVSISRDYPIGTGQSSL